MSLKFLRLFSIIFYSALLILLSSCKKINESTLPKSYGKWAEDENDLPCYNLDLEAKPAPYAYFSHIISTGHAGALLDQWGNLRLINTEGGTNCLTPNTGLTRGGFYAMIINKNNAYSLIFSELTKNKKIQYGTGYAIYSGEFHRDSLHLLVEYQIACGADRSRIISASIHLQNLAKNTLDAQLILNSDVWPRPFHKDLQQFVENTTDTTGAGFAIFNSISAYNGDFALVGNEKYKGKRTKHTLQLSKKILLAQNESLEDECEISFGKSIVLNQTKERLKSCKASWKNELKNIIEFSIEDKIIKRECVWTAAQLLSFAFYDNSTNEYYVNLGGYGMYNNPENPNIQEFAVRENPETAMCLAYFKPELAKNSLIWAFKLQKPNGDIPKTHDFTFEQSTSQVNAKESDTELWQIIGTCEYIATTGDTSILTKQIPYWKSGRENVTYWMHLKNSFYWVRDSIGTGSHGLVKICKGDWNDYLSKIGARGKGESIMNTGMACYGMEKLAAIALQRGDTSFAAELTKMVSDLRKAAKTTFDNTWFIRGYDDEGNAIGGSDDRLFLDGQSWAVLGKLGTAAQRKLACENAVKFNSTKIGMAVLSKPYSSPAPGAISEFSLPSGEGENGGIWPQTVYWMVWAMANEGLKDLALQEWKKMSLENHARQFPDVPYGIFNGPDCYSSSFAGKAEGWTQNQVFKRDVPTPQNPIIAWQYFAIRKILE